MLDKNDIKFNRICQIPANRRALRSMIIGYYVDENGLAVDAEGQSLGEHFPGEFLGMAKVSKLKFYRSPGKFQILPFDDNRFVELVGEDGKFAMRVYITDRAMLNNFITQLDVTRGEGINELYTLLACSQAKNQQRFSVLRPLDLAIALRRLKDSSYLKIPYYQDLTHLDYIAAGQLKDPGMLNLAKLSGLKRNAEASSFAHNTTIVQLKQLAYIINPDNWKYAFPMRSIIGWRDPLGRPILPMHYNDAGRLEYVREDDSATYENFLLAATHLIIDPAIAKIAQMLNYFHNCCIDFELAHFSDERVDAWNELISIIDDRMSTVEVA